MPLKVYITLIIFQILRSSSLKKILLIKTYTFQAGILALGIIGIFSLFLCFQSPAANCRSGSNDNETTISSGGIEIDIAALRCKTRKNLFSETDDFSSSANSAEFQTDNSLQYLKFISNIHNKTAVYFQLNYYCGFIIHTTPTRAGPYFFFA